MAVQRKTGIATGPDVKGTGSCEGLSSLVVFVSKPPSGGSASEGRVSTVRPMSLSARLSLMTQLSTIVKGTKACNLDVSEARATFV